MPHAQPRPSLHHLQFARHASGHLLSPIIVIYQVVFSVLKDTVNLIPNSHPPTVDVPSFLLVKPFESSAVCVADAFQGNSQNSSLCSKEDHPECFARRLEELVNV